MLLNVSLTNTNNHGEKQAKAENLVEGVSQWNSDARWLRFVSKLDIACVTGLGLYRYHLLPLSVRTGFEGEKGGKAQAKHL